jgi:hypothetical protein
MIEWFVNVELERLWKAWGMNIFKVLSRTFWLEGLRKIKLILKSWQPDAVYSIWNQDILNMKQEWQSLNINFGST